MKTIPIKDETLAVLDRLEIAGNNVRIAEQLPRDLYHDVAKVLGTAGGKWQRKAQAIVFDEDPKPIIEQMVLTGCYTRTKQDFGQFDTPPDLAQRLVALAKIKPGMRVLEPSVGIGNIAFEIERADGHVTGFEIDARRLHACKDRCEMKGGIHLSDFMSCQMPDLTRDEGFDRVVMNPPFANRADVRHIDRAAQMLQGGGRLVAIASAGLLFRSDRETKKLRNIIEALHGEIEPLPEGSFKEAGTMVRAVVVSFNV